MNELPSKTMSSSPLEQDRLAGLPPRSRFPLVSENVHKVLTQMMGLCACWCPFADLFVFRVSFENTDAVAFGSTRVVEVRGGSVDAAPTGLTMAAVLCFQ